MMIAVRYVLPAIVILVGIVILAVSPTLLGLEGFVLFVAAGSSILLLNVLHRVGVKGEQERYDEEAAREYFDKHGRWPDD
ncbi:MAG TPA: hypothetical protein VL120_06095 [Solirubrobacteraceae bacterium]|jgi:hypothetical protein|nr:hypothetical protein [Solirubrobacteraceae bacterium]